jgi:hypothetical protein
MRDLRALYRLSYSGMRDLRALYPLPYGGVRDLRALYRLSYSGMRDLNSAVPTFLRRCTRSYSAVPTFLQRYPLKCWNIKTANIVEIHKIPSVLSHSPRLPAGCPQVQVVLGGFVDSRAKPAVTDHSLFEVRQQPCASLLTSHIFSCQHAFQIQHFLLCLP